MRQDGETRKYAQISSKSGFCAECALEALGINLDLAGPEDLGRVFEKGGDCLSYLPKICILACAILCPLLGARVPTVMNLTGPLINPIPLETQLLGNQSSGYARKYGRDSKNLGRKRAVVVSGPQGLDEAGLDGKPSSLLWKMDRLPYPAFNQKDIGMERIEIDQVR